MSTTLNPSPDERSYTAEDRLRLVIDTTPALIHSGRPDGYLDFFNRRWLEYLGLSLEDICGWRWTNAIHPEDIEEIGSKWRTSLATGEPFEAEARVRRADGEYRRLLHRTVPLRDERGNIIQWYGSSIDIEDRRRAEDAVRRSEVNLAEAQKHILQLILDSMTDSRGPAAFRECTSWSYAQRLGRTFWVLPEGRHYAGTWR
jgi:PAS domain S-box-containing protein